MWCYRPFRKRSAVGRMSESEAAMNDRLEIKAWQDPETGLTWHYWLDETKSILFDDAQAISPQEDGRPTIPVETAGEVRIPERIEDLNVGFIDTAAFQGCTRLTRIILPSELEGINDAAFAGCTALQEICLPKPLFGIGKEAFKGCTSLRALHSNRAGWLDIDADAFSGCTSLEPITIPNCVTSIGSYAFSGCTAPIKWGDEPTITVIGEYAFAYYDGTSISIPKSVTSIGKLAFVYCGSLKLVAIGGGVTSIGSSAFWYCESLERVTFAGSVEQWQKVSKGSWWNSGCPLLTKVDCAGGSALV